VTLRELVLTLPRGAFASAVGELALVAGAITAAFYVGACIGSFGYAVGKTITPRNYLEVLGQMQMTNQPWILSAVDQATNKRGTAVV
jgi:hypothetical protein